MNSLRICQCVDQSKPVLNVLVKEVIIIGTPGHRVRIGTFAINLGAF